jgi:hypothetical protein
VFYDITCTRVDNVHAIFGRTKGRQPLPGSQEGVNQGQKSPRKFPRSCHHHNPTP